MRSVVFYFILFFPFNILCRDALQFFIKHKKIEHVAIEVLKNVDNSAKKWIEYKYIFKNNKNKLEISNTLKIGIVINSGSKFDCHLINKKENATVIKGYSNDVVENLKETLNISIHFEIIENLTDLTTPKADLIICHPYVENLPLNITELYPTIRSNLVIVYKPRGLSFTKDIFILTFAGSLWLVFFVILILLAVCLRISTTKYSTFDVKYESWTWVEITLWAIAAACQQGLSHTPSGFVSCCIFFLGYLMAYLLYTGFAAAITSILLQHDVETNAELNNIRPEKLYLISAEYTRFHIKHFKGRFFKTEYVNDLDTLYENLNMDYRIGIGPEILILQYMADNFNYEEISHFRTLRLNITYMKGFFISRNSPWKEIINKQIMAMDGFGILQNRLKRNLRPTQMFDFHSGYSSAGQEHVGSAILLFLGGVLISVLFLMAEFILYFYKRGRNQLGL